MKAGENETKRVVSIIERHAFESNPLGIHGTHERLREVLAWPHPASARHTEGKKNSLSRNSRVEASLSFVCLHSQLDSARINLQKVYRDVNLE